MNAIPPVVAAAAVHIEPPAHPLHSPAREAIVEIEP
jgi:hypothetical protein